MEAQEITELNLMKIHEILIQRDVEYDLINVMPDFPGECLIQVSNEFFRKRAVHSLLGNKYFVVSSPEMPSILKISLLRVNDIKEVKGDSVELAKGAVNIVSFVAEQFFQLEENNDYTISRPIYDISTLTKMVEIRFENIFMAMKVYDKLKFLGLKLFLHIEIVDSTLHIIIDGEMDRRIDANIRHRCKKIIEFVQTLGTYNFVVPNIGSAKQYLRLNLGSKANTRNFVGKIRDHFPEYEIVFDGRVLSVTNVSSTSYKELYIRGPKAFSATTFLENNLSITPSIEEVLDLLYANSNVDYTRKRPKRQKNNLYVGFFSWEDAMLGAKVLTSSGFACFWKVGVKNISVPVVEEFGLWNDDTVENSRKSSIEKKFRVK